MSGFESRGGGTAFSQTEALAEATVPLRSPSPVDESWQYIWVSINLANTLHRALVINSLRANPIQFVGPLKLLPVVFHTNDMSWLIMWTFQKSLKGS